MPKKEKPTLDDKVENVVLEETFAAACGHVNKQHYGTDGRLQDLICNLPKGHDGDHRALYAMKIGEPVNDEKGRVIRTNYREEERYGYWNDSAGKTAAPADGVEMEQTSLWQKDLIMRIMAKDPDMTVEKATQKAKQDPAWNAANAPG